MPCPGSLYFSHIADYLYDVCPVPDPDVGFSVLVCDVESATFHCGMCSGCGTTSTFVCNVCVILIARPVSAHRVHTV